VGGLTLAAIHPDAGSPSMSMTRRLRLRVLGAPRRGKPTPMVPMLPEVSQSRGLRKSKYLRRPQVMG